MAKNAIGDYSATPDDNTDIAGLDIRGTADVRNFDNALRTLMGHLRTWYDAVTSALAARLEKAQNLADVPDKAAARTALALDSVYLSHGAAQALTSAQKAQAQKNLGGWREVARTTLSGASVIFDFSDDARRFLIEIDDLRTSGGDGSLYVRCANAGGAADQGGTDYYGQSLGRAGGSDISGDVTSNLCALGSFGVAASGRMTIEGTIGAVGGLWGLHFEGRMSNSTTSTMAVREFIRTASGRKPRLYLFTNAPAFGGGSIVVSERA